MHTENLILERLRELSEIAPAGYAVALHIRYSTPTFLFQTYPKQWVDYYSNKGLVMQDPTVAWAFSNTGTRRWSDLADQDAAGVFGHAAEHGLGYGTTIAVEDATGRSMASAARSDREYADDEIAVIEGKIAELHTLASELTALSDGTTAALKNLAVDFSHSAGR